jgi:carbamoyltransferase
VAILGISAFYHDSAATMIDRDGTIVAAAQEERFTRIKHDEAFPEHAIRYCLEQGKIKLADLDHIIFYDKPFLKFDRLLETYLAYAPRGFASFMASAPVWFQEKLFLKYHLISALNRVEKVQNLAEKLLFSEHHLSHAASAFYPSPFEEAVILTMDGVGEWATSSLAIGRGHEIEMLKEMRFPHSLGLLYSAFTYYLGFKVNSGEYKVMGLAPYGVPRYADIIRTQLLDIAEDGSFRMQLDYFDYCTGLRMTNQNFDRLFGAPPRQPESPLSQRDMDIAASLQLVTEEIVQAMVRHAVRETGITNLCLAGGVALNCVANGKVLREGLIKNIWVQPAAGDAGGSLGAAYVAHYCTHSKREVKPTDAMQGSYLGPEFSQSDIEERLSAAGAVFEVLPIEEVILRTAQDLADEKAIGWFQGKMEFGPRALGNRSILGDPRSPSMQSVLNMKVKFRESFRPFAPSVLREDVSEWFDLACDSPYMLLVAEVAAAHHKSKPVDSTSFGIERLNEIRSDIPAVTHVDYSARVQTVHADTNPLYHRLITAFKTLTGCPVVVNTSFNIRGEPIVCTPEDAFRCFMGTHIERLVVGNCYLRKEVQDSSDATNDYKASYHLD